MSQLQIKNLKIVKKLLTWYSAHGIINESPKEKRRKASEIAVFEN
jgi:hypothetical protein